MIGLIEATTARSSSASASNFFFSDTNSPHYGSNNNNNNSPTSFSEKSYTMSCFKRIRHNRIVNYFFPVIHPYYNNNNNASYSSSSGGAGRTILFCMMASLIVFTIFGVVKILNGSFSPNIVPTGVGSSSSTSSLSENNQDNNNNKPQFDLLRHKRNDPRHDTSHHVVVEPHNNKRHANGLADDQQHLLKNEDGEETEKAVIDCDKTKKNETESSSSSQKTTNRETEKFPILRWNMKGYGVITMRLRPDAAPETVSNMLRLVREGKYNKTGCAYRYERGFVMQFGLCSRIDHKTVPLEYKLPNEKWSVSMARSSNPHSGGTEFFINLANNTRGLGPHRKGGYAVFGEVIDGFDVVHAMKKLPVHSSAGKDPKTGRTKKGGLMLFDKPVPHFSGVTIDGEDS